MTTTEIPLLGSEVFHTSFFATDATFYLSLALSSPWQSRRFLAGGIREKKRANKW